MLNKQLINIHLYRNTQDLYKNVTKVFVIPQTFVVCGCSPMFADNFYALFIIFYTKLFLYKETTAFYKDKIPNIKEIKTEVFLAQLFEHETTQAVYYF